jgi:hypothetical protein
MGVTPDVLIERIRDVVRENPARQQYGYCEREFVVHVDLLLVLMV